MNDFAALPELKKLILRQNQIPDEGFGGEGAALPASLEELDLYDNQLKKLPKVTIGGNRGGDAGADSLLDGAAVLHVNRLR